MMLIGADKINPYERMLLLTFKQAMENCPYLDVDQQRRIETKLQEIVDVWTKESKV